MTRVTKVERARKSPGKCGSCQAEIQAGDPYYHWSPGFRSRYKALRCAKHPPKPWETESNPKRAALIEAEYLIVTATEADRPDSAVATLENAIGLVETAKEELEASASSIQEHFQYSEKAEAMERHASELDEWINTANEVMEKLGEWEPDEEEEEEDRSWESAFEDLPEIPTGEW